MRIVFAGSPEPAVPSLRALLASEHDVVGVVTRADAPQGRRRVLTPTPVAVVAEAAGVPVVRTNRLDAEATSTIAGLAPDLGVIVAYGGLVREPLLSTPPLGWMNLHFSLLPRWRGAAPVQHSIMAGDEITGATVFDLVPELDAGAIYGQTTELVGPRETSGSLLGSLAVSGAELVLRVISSLADGSADPVPQSGDVTLAPKLLGEHGRIAFDRSARVVDAHVRGVTPEPGAFAILDGDRVKLLEVALASDVSAGAPGSIFVSERRVLVSTADGSLELLRVQPAGRKAMLASDWFRGLDASHDLSFEVR